MLYLIQYDRDLGKILSLREFRSSERVLARQERLKLELDLNSKAIKNEVVILEAASEAALRRTHRRYFESLEELAATNILSLA